MEVSRFADEIHAEKYRQHGETFRDSMNRVAGALTDGVREYHDFREVLIDRRFLTGGRIQAGAGSIHKLTLLNCFVSGTIEDSFVHGTGSIMDRAKEAAATMRLGGGIGYDFSTLRPSGDIIHKLGSASSGPVSFMEIFDSVGRAVQSAGHRRGAQMGVMRIDHPDILSFIHAKTNSNRLTGMNISVAVTDAFMEALRSGAAFPLMFNGRKYQEVDPASLWDSIMRATWDWAEPGVIFIDQVNQRNNLHYCEKIAATNPCVTGETEILTSKYGYVPIDDVVGEELYVWNGHEWTKVTPMKTGEDKPTLHIKFSDGSHLNCTYNHGFIRANGERVEAYNLREGDQLANAKWPIMEMSYGLKLSDNPFIDGMCALSSRADIPEAHRTMLYDRLGWLAGLIHNSGKQTNLGTLVIDTPSRSFAFAIRKILNSVGAHADISNIPRDRLPSYGTWRLTLYKEDYDALHAAYTKLREQRSLSFIFPDLMIDAPRLSLKVVSIERGALADEVFCYTDPIRNRAVFNGVMTKNCGEQPLPPYGACLLGSFNLTRYIGRDTEGKFWFDHDQLRRDVPIVVSAMDRVVDVSLYPLPEQEGEAKNKRRMGLGVTGVANAIEALGYPYGSVGFMAFLGNVLETIELECYAASMRLAIHRGAFPLFDSNHYGNGLKIRELPVELQKDIRRYGIRNSHLTSIAPTGTISMTADNVSSGIEPVFAHQYERIVNMPDRQRVELVQDYGVKHFGVKGRRANDISALDHLEVMAVAQEHIDSSVSKTCNVGDNVTWDEFKNLYSTAYDLGVKSLTTYRMSGKRSGILKSVDDDRRDEGACFYDPSTGTKTCE